MRPNAAEQLLFAKPGTLPLVASGPDGDAYHVRSIRKYLVLRRGLFKSDTPEEDEITTREIWTSTLAYALHLVDAVENPLPVCNCSACKKKRTTDL